MLMNWRKKALILLGSACMIISLVNFLRLPVLHRDSDRMYATHIPQSGSDVINALTTSLSPVTAHSHVNTTNQPHTTIAVKPIRKPPAKVRKANPKTRTPHRVPSGMEELKNTPINISGPVYEEDAFKRIYNPLAVQEPIKFLDNYRNPCFWQTLEHSNPYKGVTIDGRLNSRTLTLMSKYFAQRLQRGEAARLRCLPAFFMAGVQKCGSTELFTILPQQSQIASMAVKENHWWNRGRHKSSSIDKSKRISLEGYLDLFDFPAEQIRNTVINHKLHGQYYHPKITGDVSPALLWDQPFWSLDAANSNKSEPVVLTPQLIYHVLPQAKFILMLRNPTDRLYSDWLFFGGKGNATTFHNLVEKAINWFNNCLVTETMRACMYKILGATPFETDRSRGRYVWYHPAFRLRMGLYYIFINDLLDVFPHSQVMVIRLEKYSSQKKQTLLNILEFLGLDADATQPDLNDNKQSNHNVKGYATRGSMLPETRHLIDTFYQPYNEKLATLLNDDGFLWN